MNNKDKHYIHSQQGGANIDQQQGGANIDQQQVEQGIANDGKGIANDGKGIVNDGKGIANDGKGIANDGKGIDDDVHANWEKQRELELQRLREIENQQMLGSSDEGRAGPGVDSDDDLGSIIFKLLTASSSSFVSFLKTLAMADTYRPGIDRIQFTYRSN
jgi:hypothetical protein